jgi:hypothetical protein
MLRLAKCGLLQNENPASLDLAGFEKEQRADFDLFRRRYEAGHESAALIGAAPFFAQALATERICNSECGHRVFHLRQWPVPYFFVSADMIVLIEGASFNLCQVTGGECGLHAVQIAIRERQIDRLILDTYNILQQIATHALRKLLESQALFRIGAFVHN